MFLFYYLLLQSEPEDPIAVYYMRSSSGVPHRVFTGPMHGKEWCFALEAKGATFSLCIDLVFLPLPVHLFLSGVVCTVSS